jgi:hypothetical protein
VAVSKWVIRGLGGAAPSPRADELTSFNAAEISRRSQTDSVMNSRSASA